MAGLLQLSILAVALFAVVGALTAALVHRVARRRLMRLAPSVRSQALLTLCALPVIFAVGLTAVCFVPSTHSALWSTVDHCLDHGDSHLHFCLQHTSATSGSVVGWMIALGLAAALVLGLHPRLARFLRARRVLRQLAHAAELDHQRGVWLFESETALAVTTGVLHPRILVSTRLVRAMAPELVEVVVEHERAHVRRHDVLRRWVAGLLAVMHLPRTRDRLLADLALATEQACDEEAGASVGDRVRVARALLGVERLLAGSSVDFGWAGASFEKHSLTARVESLLARPAPESKAHVRLTIGLIAIALVLLAEPLHHQTETVLALLVR